MRYPLLSAAILLAISLIAAAQTTPPASAPTADQKMNQLLAPAPNYGNPLPASTQTGPTLDKTSGSSAVAPGAPNVPVIREGTHKIDRSGRLSHSADGQTAIFTFDSDGTAMQDPPMIVLPNLKLQSMEGVVAAKASDAHFRISGTVTEYKGRNYILLDKAVVMADAEKQF
jgi:hypothetical protein